MIVARNSSWRVAGKNRAAEADHARLDLIHREERRRRLLRRDQSRRTHDRGEKRAEKQRTHQRRPSQALVITRRGRRHLTASGGFATLLETRMGTFTSYRTVPATSWSYWWWFAKKAEGGRAR